MPQPFEKIKLGEPVTLRVGEGGYVHNLHIHLTSVSVTEATFTLHLQEDTETLTVQLNETKEVFGVYINIKKLEVDKAVILIKDDGSPSHS